VVRRVPVLLVLLALASGAAAEVYTWVDADGVTHIVDDPAALPEPARREALEGRSALRGLWEGGKVDPRQPAAPTPEAATGVEAERTVRLLRGAVADLERGEAARATAVFESVLRLAPNHPEAHWYLALLSHERGRFEEAEAHLQAFLASAGDVHDARRAAARRKLAQLADERRLADEASLGPDSWVGVAHPHFRVHVDAQLEKTSPRYAVTVLRYLEEAYAEVGERLGAVPAEPIGVLFYARAAYLRAHRHRFSFQTVGFFDGRMHVVSAAHPAGELRALLFHEYTHAVFREQTGGDRPFWLNEGMAELSERSSRQQPGLSLSERSWLRGRIDAGRWIPLAVLAPSFTGLDDEDARAAYLESTAAAAWIERHTDRAARGRLLQGIASGAPVDAALREVLGVTTEGLDAAVSTWIRDEFAPARADTSPPTSGSRRAGETPPAKAP
jgi:tetratricopeptide (TPR) repeat protein